MMNHTITKQNVTLELIGQTLQKEFPDLKIFFRKNLTGRHLVVQQTGSIGIGVWIKKDTLKVQEIIPSTKMAMLMGSFGMLGIMIAKMTNRKAWTKFNDDINSFIRNNF